MKGFNTDKDDIDVINFIQVYNFPKSLNNKLTELGKMLGFGNRSRIIKYILNDYYRNYTYIIENGNFYIFCDYEKDSYANNDLLDIVSKYNLEVLSIKLNDNACYRMIIFCDDINYLNSIVKSIVRIDGIVKLKFLGV